MFASATAGFLPNFSFTHCSVGLRIPFIEPEDQAQREEVAAAVGFALRKAEPVDRRRG